MRLGPVEGNWYGGRNGFEYGLDTGDEGFVLLRLEFLLYDIEGIEAVRDDVDGRGVGGLVSGDPSKRFPDSCQFASIV